MSFTVDLDRDDVVVTLAGVDRLLCWRREVRVPVAAVVDTCRTARPEVEPGLDSRMWGLGANRGDRRPGRRRVGAFLGRDTAGRPQFWAVSAGSDEVIVVEVEGQPFARLVLDGACVDRLGALLDAGRRR